MSAISQGNAEIDQSLKDWEDLSQEYSDLEDMHGVYRSKLDELHSLQKKCISGVKHQRYRLMAVQKLLDNVDNVTEEQANAKTDLVKDILRRRAQLSQMEDYLPRQSGSYLKVILGSVNVSILDKEAKYQYKEQYEQFKLIVVAIGFALAAINLYVESRILFLLFMFLILWYYCTLTIRESILRVNGSKIKGWWRLHHFVSTVTAGILLVWPDGECHRLFRTQLMWFCLYVCFLSYLQFTYQRGCLYRLKTLGLRNHEMDITIDGFHSWMWKGLGFLLPFLAIGYIWQLYNSYTLYHLGQLEGAPWQVNAMSGFFFVLGTGNIATTAFTIASKVIESQRGYFKIRFTRLDKYFWTHKRRGQETTSVQRFSAGAERILRRRSQVDVAPPLMEVPEDEIPGAKEDGKSD